MAWPRATNHVAYCRACRRCRPLAEFPTATAERCNECKGKLEAERAARAKVLTPAQVSVIELVCLGKTNDEIGAILHRSPLTVKNHVQAVIHKLDASNRTYAAVKYTVAKIKEQI